MGFEVGNPGKPKGALNKRSKEFQEILARHNFCPITAMIEVYQEAKKVYDNYGTIYDAICDAKILKQGELGAPPEDKADKYLKIAGDMAKDMASYAYPKLKAVEQSKIDVTNDMTPEQRLEAMKHAVALLELQLKKDVSGSGAS